LIGEILYEDFKKVHPYMRVYKYLVSYAEYQFGNRVPGKDYRERENEESIDNWTVKIEILIVIYNGLASLYFTDESLSTINIDNLKFPLHEKMRDLLRPCSADLDSNSTARIDSMTKDQAVEILMLSVIAENSIAIIYQNRNQFNFIVNEVFLMLDSMRGQKIKRSICYAEL
jgi:hypothetical protein